MPAASLCCGASMPGAISMASTGPFVLRVCSLGGFPPGSQGAAPFQVDGMCSRGTSRGAQLGSCSPSFGLPCCDASRLCFPFSGIASTMCVPCGGASVRLPLPLDGVSILCLPFHGSTSGGGSWFRGGISSTPLRFCGASFGSQACSPSPSFGRRSRFRGSASCDAAATTCVVPQCCVDAAANQTMLAFAAPQCCVDAAVSQTMLAFNIHGAAML